MSFASTTLLGNLTSDPELFELPSGDRKVSGSVAINRKYKKKDGDEVEEVSFIDFTIWGTRGEAFAKHHRKGDRVFLDGALKQERWSTDDGQKRSKLVVNVFNWEFVKSDRQMMAGDEPRQPDEYQDTPF